MILLLFIIALFCFFSLMSIVFWTIRNGISPMPSSIKVKKILFSQALPIQVKGPILELGSAWGSLAIPLAKRYPKTRVIGYETSPIPYWISRLLAFLLQLKNLTLVKQDFFEADFGNAALILCYLYPGAMKKLKLKFEKELMPGTIIISHTFAIPSWQAETILTVPDLYQTKIYIYKFSS
jgi:hypothetical protein